MRHAARLRLVVIVAAVLLAGCASPDEAADAPMPPASPTAPTATELPTTATEPPTDASKPPTGDLFTFTAGTVDGGEIDASIYASGQVALWFWAPW